MKDSKRSPTWLNTERTSAMVGTHRPFSGKNAICTSVPAITADMAPPMAPDQVLPGEIGGASFGRHTGFGGGVGTTVPIGSRERFIVGTRMMVQIKRHSDGTVIWEGRAMTEAKGQSPDASPQAAVAKLAHALFTGFPGESGRTITVK